MTTARREVAYRRTRTTDWRACIQESRPSSASLNQALSTPFFPSLSLLVQYEATYKFNALDDTPLQKGQVTAQGLFLVDNVEDFNALELPIRFAITGGTGPYATAHGTITEGVPTKDHRLLDIEL